jgi:uncharacterized metal-binding protein
MPNCGVHSLINTIAIVPTAWWIVPKFTDVHNNLAFTAGAAFGTFIANPDLDQPYTVSEMYQFWKHEPIKLAWRMYWKPYSMINYRFPGMVGISDGHHSMFSHFPVIGTLCRALYLLAVPLIVVFIFNLPFPSWSGYFIPAFVGWCYADLWHAMADSFIHSHHKHR